MVKAAGPNKTCPSSNLRRRKYVPINFSDAVDILLLTNDVRGGRRS